MPPPEPELQARWISGEALSESEQQRIEQWLAKDAADRDEMLAHESMESQLRCVARVRDHDNVEVFVQGVLQRVFAPAASHVPAEIAGSERTSAKPRFRPSKPAYWIYAICTAVAVLVGVGFALYLAPGRGPQPLDLGYAQLVNTRNARWKLSDATPPQLNLEGYGELHYSGGTIIKINGPAVMDLKSPDEVGVQAGNLKVIVPGRTAGLTMQTPVARIFNSATELDLNVVESGATTVEVLSGTVMYEPGSNEARSTNPVRLTPGGFNRVTTSFARVAADRDLLETACTGAGGHFFGTIQADGITAEFHSRERFQQFQRDIQTAINRDPGQFHEQWKRLVEALPGKSPTPCKDPVQHPVDVSENRARELLIKQLQSIQEKHQGNPEMQGLVNQMIQKLEAEKPENED